MESLIRQRGIIKSKLTSASKFLANVSIEPTSLNILNARVCKLDEIWRDYDKVQSEIQLTCEVDQLEIQEEERESFENKYFVIKGGLDTLMCELSQQNVSSSAVTSAHTATQVKLPKLELPTFSGSYTDWTSFYDLFRVLVHENNSLSDVQKLQYLKSCLRGEASKIIQALQVSEANYKEAWKLLKERYDNKRQIVRAHYKTLLSQPVLFNASATGLRGLFDAFQENMRALSVLQADVWDTIMIHLFSERMDNESRRLWEMSLTTTETPEFSELKQFIQQRCQALEATNSDKAGQGGHNRNMNVVKAKPASVFHSAQTGTCVICNGSHPIYQCDKFLKMSPESRSAAAKRNRLCFNCLRDNHSAQQCNSGECKKCGGRHHTLLHFRLSATTKVKTEHPREHPTENDKTSNFPIVVSHYINNYNDSEVLLATVVLQVQDYQGHIHKCRALLDSGSQANFITESLAGRLNLRKIKQRVPVRGIGNTDTTHSCGKLNLRIQSCRSPFNMNISAIILPRITGKLPANPVSSTEWEHLKNIDLADPTFGKPGDVDLLLGADVFSHVIGCGKILGSSGQPTAHNTELGWILSGSCGNSRGNHVSSNLAVMPTIQVQEQLKKFWEIEECNFSVPLSLEDKRCAEHYETTTKRDHTGRYIVELPFKEDSGELGDSKKQAIFRLNQVEKRLNSNPECKRQYVQFLHEYLALGHMEKLSPEEIQISSQESFYLPHHCVIKNSSSTTKLRVVFDASATTTSGLSLNNKLMSGPTVQQDLVSILLRFRTHKVAFTADITKMYRQILVHPKHCDFQRILRRESPEEEIQEFRLKTVTYGQGRVKTLCGPGLSSLRWGP